ncbi:NAD(P)H-dependent flavin oxidoreductase [Arthrobacter roseus]|uniref:NAD(P)H-dependent flavin oxidoreductase n=1 Tax=Arthrobacter roseus TaxID=136274 RepID=UPI001966CC2E|nr:nitronate monooxygenase [Arthrobacter roseus]MBM7847078.1 nitronate monooxygenase [Arthrobacter roseus]
MFTIDQLDLPVVGAPMAGGPSTPELAAAVTNAGGLGFLAAGNTSAGALKHALERTRALTDGPFGVNIFVPDHANEAADLPDPRLRTAAVQAFRQQLAPEVAALGMELPAPDAEADDYWAAKLDLLRNAGVAVVSFTFGLPSASVVSSLHLSGSTVAVTVTDQLEAVSAVNNGADLLCVQGPLAGGHRSTHSLIRIPGDTALPELVRDVRAAVGVPLIAAGGISGPHDVVELLDAGADAVQIGTLLLRCPESGAAQAHKDALADPSFTDTTVTRAFSGRWARGLTNTFIRKHTAHAPAAYPEVNQLTKPLRVAASNAKDPQSMGLWAGPQFALATESPAADVVRGLFER